MITISAGLEQTITRVPNLAKYSKIRRKETDFRSLRPVRRDFRHDGDDYREKVRDLKAAEFHEVSRALVEKASYPLQVAEKPSFSRVDFWMKILTFD